jgi:predicted amidophosphoribosyltransferase
MSTLAALGHLYVQTHADAIAELLGGTPTAIAAVPSTRGWQSTQQPLYRALDRSSVLRTKLRVLQKHDGSAVGRREYKPGAFPVGASLRGERVILVEDLWVTGAKALSAAGALMAAGASVVLLVIGREVNSTYTDDDQPYRAAMKAPFSIDSWPR